MASLDLFPQHHINHSGLIFQRQKHNPRSTTRPLAASGKAKDLYWLAVSTVGQVAGSKEVAVFVLFTQQGDRVFAQAEAGAGIVAIGVVLQGVLRHMGAGGEVFQLVAQGLPCILVAVFCQGVEAVGAGEGRALFLG